MQYTNIYYVYFEHIIYSYHAQPRIKIIIGLTFLHDIHALVWWITYHAMVWLTLQLEYNRLQIIFSPLWPQGIIRPPFPYVSYEATKWVSRRQHVYGVGYPGLLCYLYRDFGLKRCHHSQTSRAQSPLNLIYTWCNMSVWVAPFPRSQHFFLPPPFFSPPSKFFLRDFRA